MFQRYVKNNPGNASYNYWYGACCYETGEKDKAEKYLLVGAKRRVQEAFRYLGQLYFETYRFDEAADNYASYIEMLQKAKKETVAAARAACAEEFIQNLEETYDTVIGERGVGLSGGQKQRISIARALAKKAPILVFDDATSALDVETEKEIQKMLRELKDVTKIIVGHRISAVRYADEILVLKRGRIAERGTHESLMGQKGLYYETYLSQYGA